jgi:uncharacterized protein DUF4446
VTALEEDCWSAIRISGASAMNDALSSFLAGLVAALASPIFAMSFAAAIVIAFVYHQVIARQTFASARTVSDKKIAAGNPQDVAALRARVDALETASARNLQRVGFVRFNAFPDVGSELSYALAVVDGHGNGFLVSSIYSREEVRTYAKAIRGFAADKELSDEERRAIELAKGGERA